MIITSLENNKIKEVVKLKNKKYRDFTNTFVVETEHLVEEAKKAGIIKDLFIVEDEFVDNNNTYFVTNEVMKKMSSMESPSNVLAVCYKSDSKDIVGDKILLLDGVQDPGNLGTIIRSAVAFNVDTIILSDDTVDLYNPKVVRSAKGMLFKTNVIIRDIVSFIKEIDDYQIYGTDVNEGININIMKDPNKSISGNGNSFSKDMNISSGDFFFASDKTAVSLYNIFSKANFLLSLNVAKFDSVPGNKDHLL